MTRSAIAAGLGLWGELARGMMRRRRASRTERDLAATLRRTRLEASAAMSGVRCCACCVPIRRRRGRATAAAGGGFCCRGEAGVVFSDAEVAALSLGGTRPWHLIPAAGLVRGAGCIFLGRSGCSLAPAHRPNICVSHLCVDLKRELHQAGALERVDGLCLELQRGFARFQELRQERRERRWIDELAGPF